MSRVVVLGDVMLDVAVRRLAPIAPTSDTPSRIRVSRGGSGATLALAVSAGGHDVTYLGAAGRDGASTIVRDALARANVTADLEVVDASTGTVVSLVDVDGQRSMLTDRGANSLLSGPYVLTRLAVPFDHLHVSGYVLLDAATRSIGVAALEFARERHRASSVDVCSVAPLQEMTPGRFLEAASGATQLYANEEEALVLTSLSDVDDALEFLAARFNEVVITRGARGALSANGEVRARVVAHEARVVDTTGAGDVATGTYLGARLRGELPERALEVAMAASARVVEELGADYPGT
ncbi:MAG: carbohydrate kinase family protein [Acidimicrobiales bacterium]